MDARDLRRLFVLANAFKEGDLLVGGTRDDRVRQEAPEALLATTFADIRRTVLVEDGVSEALARSRDRPDDDDLDGLTIRDLKDLLLGWPLALASRPRSQLHEGRLRCASQRKTATGGRRRDRAHHHADARTAPLRC